MGTPDRTCFVYILAHRSQGRFCAPVKVGITTNLGGRIATIQTGNPREVALAFAFATPGREFALAFEDGFHTVFAKHRMTGEWFDMPPIAALEGMIKNFQSGLKHFLGEEPDLLGDALASCGVDEAVELLERIRAEQEREAGATVQ